MPSSTTPTILSRLVLVAVIGFLALVGSVASAKIPRMDIDPPIVMILSPAPTEEHEDLIIRALVRDTNGIGEVKAWVRGEWEAVYRAVPMEQAADDSYIARLPEWSGRGNRVDYYVEAFDRNGNGPGKGGSTQSPLSARITAAAPQEERNLVPIYRAGAAILALMPIVLFVMMQRLDRKDRDRLHWTRALEPLRDKHGADLFGALDEVCAAPVPAGAARLTRVEILKRLNDMREETAPPTPKKPARQQASKTTKAAPSTQAQEQAPRPRAPRPPSRTYWLEL